MLINGLETHEFKHLQMMEPPDKSDGERNYDNDQRNSNLAKMGDRPQLSKTDNAQNFYCR